MLIIQHVLDILDVHKFHIFLLYYLYKLLVSECKVINLRIRIFYCKRAITILCYYFNVFILLSYGNKSLLCEFYKNYYIFYFYYYYFYIFMIFYVYIAL